MNDAMTAPITPSLTNAELERLIEQGDAVLGPHDGMAECVQRNLMTYVNMWLFRQTLERTRELLAYRRAGVAVKPLEWSDDGQNYAKDPWGGYWITEHFDKDDCECFGWAHSSRADMDESYDWYGMVEHAKEAAQADYEARIRSCLVTPPPARRADADLRAIEAMFEDGQGDDDGAQVLPDFEPGMSTLAKVEACLHFLERRRDVIEGGE